MQHASIIPADLLAPFRRSPSEVMRLARLGCAHPTRLSFLRQLLRRVEREGWRFDRPLWEVDSKGVGRAVYRAEGPLRTYSLVAFAHDLPDHLRSDRVIATAWDATFALVDGEPDAADLDRLVANVPLQEAGRVTAKELTLSRANRSVRLFAHAVECLAEGRQPERAEVDAVGYLMRTTAVYGSGKFGAADRETIANRPELAAPFQAEMLTVWLIRAFTVDIVEHLADVRGGAKAIRLDPEIRRSLGVGNSTGLGMAPFLVHHPVLLNNWVAAREEALARVRAQRTTLPEPVAALRTALAEARENAALWRSEHPVQAGQLADLRRDLDRIAERLLGWPLDGDAHPWDELWRWGEGLSLEGQEALLALLLEPHGDLVDDLCDRMDADEAASFAINGAMTAGELRAILKDRYDWALAVDFADPREVARFWYVSEEKLEPRIGDRFHEEGAEREHPLGIARLARELFDALASRPQEESLAYFLLDHPEHRYMVRRAQIARLHSFSEICGNLIGQDMLPIDMLRCKLAFFGASRFDPRSDKWVRISLFQGAPCPAFRRDARGLMIGSSEPADEPSRSEPDGHVRLSLNEIEALCLQAARGAGMSWGMAEEAGSAARWLSAQELDGPGALLALLDETVGRNPLALWPRVRPGGCTSTGDLLCPVALGVALSDLAARPEKLCAGGELRADAVAQPLLLLPFLSQLASRTGQWVGLNWDGGRVALASDGRMSGSLASLGQSMQAAVVLTFGQSADEGPIFSAQPSVLEAPTVSGLEVYALLTAVPASDASRTGAGAASSDND